MFVSILKHCHNTKPILDNSRLAHLGISISEIMSENQLIQNQLFIISNKISNLFHKVQLSIKRRHFYNTYCNVM